MFEHALPGSLLRQGAIMHAALLADLAAIPGVELTTLRDARLPLADLPPSVRVIPVQRCGAQNVEQNIERHVEPHLAQHFDDCLQDADAVWLLAPECGAILERLTRKVQGRRILLGSGADAVRLAGNKLLAVRALAAAGIPVAPTYALSDLLPDAIQPWVVKPIRGAACLDTRLFSSHHKARAWIAGAIAQQRFQGDGEDGGDGDYVLQPFIAGQACSLSLLCCHGAARLLSCNLQRVAVRDNQFHFLGSTVNGIIDVDGKLVSLARRIGAAMPGLWGYVGVDLILTANAVVVLEVNPRMTTSFAGLHTAIGCNPAQLVLDLLDRPLSLSQPAFKRIVVSVDADAFDSG